MAFRMNGTMIIRFVEVSFMLVLVLFNLRMVFYNNVPANPQQLQMQNGIREARDTQHNANEGGEDETINVHKNMKDSEVIESLKNPGFAAVHDMDRYFNDSLKLGITPNKKRFVTFGIPTVKRNKAYYVIKTVKSLLDHMLPSEKEEVVIVIFIADQDEAFIDKLIKDTKQNFPQEVSDGLIHVVLPDKSYYPNLNNLPRLFGDKMERVKWRSKQCLDYSYLYYYSRNLAEYFVQLEDDIIAVDGYIAKMKEFIKKNQNKKWSVLEFGARGFIGMTYKSKHLESLSKFVRFFFWTMPVDILFRVYNDIYLHKNSKEFQIKPPVFKHIGKFSSLKGQVRTLEDLGEKSDSNVKGRRRYQSPKGNPPAKLSSSLKEFYLNNRLENPYTKTGVMWATKPKNGDTIDIMFSNRQHVKRIVFASGIDHKDVFYKTKLHVSSSKEGDSCVNYQLVGKFEGDIVDHSFTSNQQSIWCVRLELDVVHTIKGKPNWIFIEEIAILL